MKMKKIIGLLLIVIIISSLFGCSDTGKLPEGFKNKKLYEDLVYILQTTKNDLETGTLTHSLDPEKYKNDKFLKHFETYKNKNLTEKEEKAKNIAWQVLSNLNMYFVYYPNIKLTGYKDKTLEYAEELLKIMEIELTK